MGPGVAGGAEVFDDLVLHPVNVLGDVGVDDPSYPSYPGAGGFRNGVGPAISSIADLRSFLDSCLFRSNPSM